jgi:hypothetical protein
MRCGIRDKVMYRQGVPCPNDKYPNLNFRFIFKEIFCTL